MADRQRVALVALVAARDEYAALKADALSVPPERARVLLNAVANRLFESGAIETAIDALKTERVE